MATVAGGFKINGPVLVDSVVTKWICNSYS